MKKLIVLTILTIASATANATSSTTALLNNFNISLVSGGAPTFNLTSFNGGTNATLDATELPDIISGLPSSLIFNASSSLEDGVNNSHANAYYDPTDPTSSLSSEAFGVTSQLATSTAYARITFQYLANSVLYFSADASVSAFSNDPNGNSFSSAIISLNQGMKSVGYDLIYTDSYGDPTVARSLGFSYSSNKDQTLTLLAQVVSNSLINPVTTSVPEPTSYALFLAGLTLISLIARRKIK